VVKRLIVPAFCGIALLRFDYIVVEAGLNWLVFRIICLTAITLLTVLIILLNRGFMGCGRIRYNCGRRSDGAICGRRTAA
jgi:hypothetical protein